MRLERVAQPTQHGKYTTYNHLGCRCDACRAAWAIWHQDYMHRTGRSLPRAEAVAKRWPEPPPHGTISRYGPRHRCRCADCREAMRVYMAGYRARIAGRSVA